MTDGSQGAQAALQTESSIARALEARIASGTAGVAVLGAGYVGLPLALAFVRHGHPVWAVDVDQDKVSRLRSGGSYVRDVADAEVQAALRTARFQPTADHDAATSADAILICVPTPFTTQKQPDTSFIVAAAEQIASRLRPGHLVILRSTSYPGTTEELVRPLLERHGFRVGTDIFLAFAPERIDPGNSRYRLEEIPVVVGGCDPVSTHLAGALLGRIHRQVVPVSSPAAAEMAKLLENIFRNVNIALVNQIAQLCDRMGLDVWEVVDAAATKPYGFMAFFPGLVGGHCIPVDPYYLAWKAREYDYHMDFIELAARVNEDMPYYVVNKLMTALRRNGRRRHPERVLVLGVAFKKDVDDARHSPALRVIELLMRQQVEVTYHDHYIPEISIGAHVMRSVALTPEVLAETDCVLILTDHSTIDYDMLLAVAPLVFDTRNATKHVTHHREKIVRL